MIAKVIAHGRDRAEALARLHRALAQMTVLVRGGTTNKSFLLDLLERPEIRNGEFDTAWLDRLTAADEHLPTRLADVALDRCGDRRRRPAGGARAGNLPGLGEPWSSVRRRAGRSRGRVPPRRAGLPRRRAAGGPVALRDRALRIERHVERHRRCRAARPGPQPPDDRRAQLRRGLVGAGHRPPRRGRRGRSPVLTRRCRDRAGTGRGARRRRGCRARRHRRGRAAAGGRRGDEDGAGHHLAGQRTGPRRVRHSQRAGRRRYTADPDRTAHRRRRRCADGGDDRLRRAATLAGNRSARNRRRSSRNHPRLHVGLRPRGRPHPAHARRHQRRSRAGRCRPSAVRAPPTGDLRCVQRSLRRRQRRA